MSAFQQIARQFATKNMQSAVNKQQRKHITQTVASTDSILVIYDGRDQAIREAVEQFSHKHQKIRVEQFFLTSPESVDSHSFSAKQTNWADIPKPEVVQRCNQIDVKLLMLFNPADLPSLHYLATVHQAQMKVATNSQFPSDADLIYDMRGTDFSAYMKQLEEFMSNILV